ncbi:MAG: hypothetical protein PSN44_04450 [Gammaproteobacteria bacterium]|nr:hypothetical protein [Gammaproteobacteria bacterium]
MFSLKAKIDSSKTAGFSISAEGIALAIIEHNTISPILQYAQFHPCSPNGQAALLSELVHQHQLDKLPCNLVLSPEEYQLTQVDAPEVPRQELRAALHWHVKDFILMMPLSILSNCLIIVLQEESSYLS